MYTTHYCLCHTRIFVSTIVYHFWSKKYVFSFQFVNKGSMLVSLHTLLGGINLFNSISNSFYPIIVPVILLISFQFYSFYSIISMMQPLSILLPIFNCRSVPSPCHMLHSNTMLCCIPLITIYRFNSIFQPGSL